MTKIDIFSGFLGAGKTTLIKKLLNEAYKNEKVVLIENEFGEIGIDGGFLKDAGVEITEMNSGCICCSLVGDFAEALKKVLAQFTPDRILIEPSGVGKLSDVIKAVKDINSDNIELSSFTAVVDAKKCKMYMKNFGEFYNDQIENASCIVLSHTGGMDTEKINNCIELVRGKNPSAAIISTDWDELCGSKILEAMEGSRTLASDIEKLESEACTECGHHHHHDHDEHCGCGHEHHHHDHDEHCDCGHEHHHHDHDEHCGCGHEHHHDHDEHCGCGHEHHHHDYDEHCDCGHEHHHHDHGHHHADEVFASWGKDTAQIYTEEQIKNILSEFDISEEYGIILRAKGIVRSIDGKWLHFDYIPGEADVRFGIADITGRLCVIGSKLDCEKIEKLFD